MNTKEMIWSSVWRFLRVMAGQAIAYWATNLMGVSIPIVNLSLGAVINMVAKFLRDKYKWDWLIV